MLSLPQNHGRLFAVGSDGEACAAASTEPRCDGAEGGVWARAAMRCAEGEGAALVGLGGFYWGADGKRPRPQRIGGYLSLMGYDAMLLEPTDLFDGPAAVADLVNGSDPAVVVGSNLVVPAHSPLAGAQNVAKWSRKRHGTLWLCLIGLVDPLLMQKVQGSGGAVLVDQARRSTACPAATRTHPMRFRRWTLRHMPGVPCASSQRPGLATSPSPSPD